MGKHEYLIIFSTTNFCRRKIYDTFILFLQCRMSNLNNVSSHRGTTMIRIIVVVYTSLFLRHTLLCTGFRRVIFRIPRIRAIGIVCVHEYSAHRR